MFQEITSKDVEITSPLSDLFVSSRAVRTRIDEPERSFWEETIKKRFLSAFPLSEIMQTESVSSRDQPPEFDNETVLTEEFYKKSEQRQLLLKISEMIDKITEKEDIFKGIDKHKLLETISKMLSDISVEWNKISYEEFFERTKRLLVLEAMSGILKELKPEQIEIFDEAIKRRPLFK